jgi:molecular chaperone DnaK (HSP70)
METEVDDAGMPRSNTCLLFLTFSATARDILIISKHKMSDDAQTPEKYAIGIAFGNSNSSIAATIAGDAQVIANEEGDRQIPTALSYVDGEEFHGAQAKTQLVRNPKNTVTYFRDFIGKEYV